MVAAVVETVVASGDPSATSSSRCLVKVGSAVGSVGQRVGEEVGSVMDGPLADACAESFVPPTAKTTTRAMATTAKTAVIPKRTTFSCFMMAETLLVNVDSPGLFGTCVFFGGSWSSFSICCRCSSFVCPSQRLKNGVFRLDSRLSGKFSMAEFLFNDWL